MPWQQYERRPEGARRQLARDARRMPRGTSPDWRPSAVSEGAAQLRRYEAYVSQLVTLHGECGEWWDWDRISTLSPVLPALQRRAEVAARDALAGYRPGLADRITGRAASRRTRLAADIDRAIELDRERHEAVLRHHGTAYRQWLEACRLAPGVLALDIIACRDALRVIDAFGDVEAFGTSVELAAISPLGATIACAITDPDLVPRDELTLSPTGELSSKQTPARKYWALYRDHVQSCAVRVARETAAALPVDHVIVNMFATAGVPILAVQFTSHLLDSLMHRAVDPTDALRVFPHRMHFQSAAGFQPVDAMTAATARLRG